jgi:hypothetical protein
LLKQEPAYPADLPGSMNGGIQALQIRPTLLSSSGTPVAIDSINVVPQSRRVCEFRLLPGTFGIGSEPTYRAGKHRIVLSPTAPEALDVVTVLKARTPA